MLVTYKNGAGGTNQNRQTSVKERTETQKQQTKSKHEIAILAEKLLCVKAAHLLSGSHKDSREYPTYYIYV